MAVLRALLSPGDTVDEFPLIKDGFHVVMGGGGPSSVETLRSCRLERHLLAGELEAELMVVHGKRGDEVTVPPHSSRRRVHARESRSSGRHLRDR